jgi:hypothetical protein
MNLAIGCGRFHRSRFEAWVCRIGIWPCRPSVRRQRVVGALLGLKCGVCVAAICALLAFSFAAIEATTDAHQLAPKAATALGSINRMEQSTSDLEEATYATEGEVANLADSLNEIAQGLSSHEASELEQAREASSKLSMLLDQADVDVLAFGQTEQATTAAINGIAADSHATLGAAQSAIADAAVQVSNPAIAASLSDIRDSAANVKDSTAQITVTTQQLSAAATDARQVADHWRAVALAPVSTARKVTMFAASVAQHLFGL